MTSPQEPNSAPNDKRICIGKIASSHGVKGLVKIAPFCEDFSLLNGKIFTSETGSNTLNITLKNSVGKYVLAQIEGITSPEQVKDIKFSLYIPREELPDINDSDEFYIEDLAGLTALNDKKEEIGKIVTVQNYGAGNLLEVKPLKGESYFVPFEDEYLPEINLTEKYVIVMNADNFIIE